MEVRAALVTQAGGPFEVHTIEVDPPRAHEVQVRMAFAGLCWSDETLRQGGVTLPVDLLRLVSGRDTVFPIVAGHEGAGVVEEVGDQVTGLAPGDHVAISFVPSCGTCDYCRSGRPYLCDLMATIVAGPQISDGTYRHRFEGVDLNRMCQVGAFAERVVVHEASLVRLDDWLDLRASALISCGVSTGWGSAVNRGQVRAGDVVAVIGCGGVGSGAILGALGAGARAVIAIDTDASKVERARALGATHGCATTLEAAFEVLPELTWGKNCDVVIVTVNKLHGDLIEQARSITAKGGTVVLTSLAPADLQSIDLNAAMFAMYGQDLRGTVFGAGNPRLQIPMLARWHHEGRLPVDDLITREYDLEEVEQGYADLRAGRNVRGVIRFASP